MLRTQHQYRRRRLADARSTVLKVAAAGLAAQLGAAAAVVAQDELRKRRTSSLLEAPQNPPHHAVINENALTTYTFGEHLYEAMIDAIDAAQDHVYLVSYIWKGDEVGHRFKDAVIRAHQRGVLVCLVFDGFANLVVPREFKHFPDGVQVLRFPTTRGGLELIDIRRSGRDHRKVLVVDGTVGFVGGYNIGSLYANQWRDTHLQVTGPAVWELTNTFVDFWNAHSNQNRPQLPNTGKEHWDNDLRAARNDPSRLVYPVRGLYLDAIDRATTRIWITQGYFIPDQEITQGLLEAAQRGVDVRVIMPQRSNHVLADVVAHSYFEQFLTGRVRLFLYQDAMVHAKTMTVDGIWATIGTANIDALSLRGNYEVNMELCNADQAHVMERIFAQDLTNCIELDIFDWQQRHSVSKAAEWILRPLQAFL